jgi:hypothetical protein
VNPSLPVTRHIMALPRYLASAHGWRGLGKESGPYLLCSIVAAQAAFLDDHRQSVCEDRRAGRAIFAVMNLSASQVQLLALPTRAGACGRSAPGNVFRL